MCSLVKNDMLSAQSTVIPASCERSKMKKRRFDISFCKKEATSYDNRTQKEFTKQTIKTCVDIIGYLRKSQYQLRDKRWCCCHTALENE